MMKALTFVVALFGAAALKTVACRDICKVWADQPSRFRYDPTHLTAGLNT